MNLMVVARRPEVAERCAATVQALTGRHPSRTLVIGSADRTGRRGWSPVRGELRDATRGRTGDLCRDDPRHGRRRGGTPPDRDRDTADHPRPAGHGVVARRAAAGRAGADLLGRGPADRRRLDVERRWPDRLREMAAVPETTRLAISDFALVRQSRWREAIASIFDDPDFLPYLRSLRRIAVTYATHDETGRRATNLVKPIYHVGWLASRLGLESSSASPRSAGHPSRSPRPRARAKPDTAAASRRRCRTGVRGRRRRPAGRVADAARDDAAGGAARRAARIRAACRRDRRSGDRPRPGLAGRRRSARPGVPRAATDRSGPAGRSHRVRATGSGRRSARSGGGRADRPDRAASDGAMRGEPAHADRRRRRRPPRRSRRTRSRPARPTRSAARGRADWATTGGSTPSGSAGALATRRCATRSRGPTSTSGGATTGSFRATTRSRTSSRSTTSCSGSAGEEGIAGGPWRAAPEREPSIRSRPARRSAEGAARLVRGRSWPTSSAPRSADRRRLAGRST